ncbi:MAG: methyltransferase [Saprospiraceae bacterium]|nr:methyltransferase [Saprospiraceae bacterium]
MEIVAKTFHGLEPVLASELEQIGATNIQPYTRAVSFEGDMRVLYRANFECRTALRVYVPFLNFKAKHENHFYKKIKSFDWQDFMSVDQTFAIDATVHSQYFSHSKYVALKAKDAIVDKFRTKTNRRPNINVENPDFRFHLHIQEENISLQLDSSGDSLHKRGYRANALRAPLNEVLAAGMVLTTGWNDDKLLFDPMCGSGTIGIEAALIAADIAPQTLRTEFAFMKWKDYDKVLWSEIRETAAKRHKDVKATILCKDIQYRAVETARENARNAGVEKYIQFDKGDFLKEDPPAEEGLMIMNPPYDERLGVQDMESFYGDIGTILKHKYGGWNAWLLSSNFEALKKIGLKPFKKKVLYNGALECKYQGFEMFAGKRKEFLATKDENE